MHGGAYMRGGAYTWSKTNAKEKEGTYLQRIGGAYSQRNTVCSPVPL